MKKSSNKCNSGSFDDLSGQSRELKIDEVSKDITIDGKPIGVKFHRQSKSYESQSGESLGTVSQLGNVVEFCKKFLQNHPTFA